MLFRRETHDAIRRGDVTAAYRRWKRANVRAGGRYRLDADGVIEVTSVEAIDERAITDADARTAGSNDRDALLRDLARFHSGDGASSVYCVRFRYVREADPRRQLAADADLSDDEADGVIARLARLDAASTHGPWTRDTLALIEAHPETLAATLAAQVGREKLPFKADVRKLKALGLTISLERGYRLSPRGQAILRRLDEQRR